MYGIYLCIYMYLNLNVINMFYVFLYIFFNNYSFKWFFNVFFVLFSFYYFFEFVLFVVVGWYIAKKDGFLL